MSELEFDVVVIGMGPGGEHVATSLARAGLAVAGVEARLIGGECPYWACVPSKIMLRAAGLIAEARRIPGLAGAASVSPDWAQVAARIRTEATDNWTDTVAANRFTEAGGTLLRGHGRITAPGKVAVGGDVLTASRGIVINSGTLPAVPQVAGLRDTPFWTNHEAIEAALPPTSLIVLGGGSVGVELAQVFSRFGALVTIIEPAGRLLPQEEPEAGELMATVFDRPMLGSRVFGSSIVGSTHINVRTGTRASSAEYDGGRFTLTLEGGDRLIAERLLVAAGRRTDLPGLGVGAVGLDESAGTITTDDRMRAAPGVWAIGDVVGKGAFTHMSLYEADIVIADILGRPHHQAEYHAVPRVTFTDPEVGAVGLTEAQARDQLASVATAVSQIPASSRGWIYKAGNDGFIKLVADAGRGVLVGATSAGPAGGEVLGMLTLAVHAAVPVQRLREMIYAYPTFHRAVLDALDALQTG
jgi:pyruvate/2-oxoglutarate dehydrogenase complex dihydrolipoamide dehydrogenase (E3) component